MRKTNKKGFTLIELLAVIIILGVLMLIAIPSVTEYINSSRKSAFVSTAKQYISAVMNKTNEYQDFVFTDPTKIYYVPVSNVPENSCVSLEKGGTSPFGEWETAYVAVTFDAVKDSYSYYFTGHDKALYGMTGVTQDVMENDDVEATWQRKYNSTVAGADANAKSAKSYPEAGDTVIIDTNTRKTVWIGTLGTDTLPAEFGTYASGTLTPATDHAAYTAVLVATPDCTYTG